MPDPYHSLTDALKARFGDTEAEMPPSLRPQDANALARMAGRGSVRQFQQKPVEDSLVDLLCAVALSAPTKSDLQQRDIFLLRDPRQREAVDALLAPHGWTSNAPVFLIFCGNHRRQRHVHEIHDRPFVNDHLDAFFNASVDAGIALATCVAAAETVGLGTCPVSAIRNEAAAVSALLRLPDLMFPVAGLALGWPATPPQISPRLDLNETVHETVFHPDQIAEQEAIRRYDARRNAQQPYSRQRFESEDGHSTAYGWSEDKARQYARPERQDFGAFIRNKNFNLD